MAYQHIYQIGLANDGKEMTVPAAVPALPPKRGPQ